MMKQTLPQYASMIYLNKKKKKNLTDNSRGLRVVMALLGRFNTQTFPGVLAIKKRVDRDKLLDQRAIDFLKALAEHVEEVKPLFDGNPEYQDRYTKAQYL